MPSTPPRDRLSPLPSFGARGRVTFGAPLAFDDLYLLPDCKETHQLIVDRVMDAIASLLPDRGLPS